MYRCESRFVSVFFEESKVVTVELSEVALKLNHTALIANQHHIPFAVMPHLKKTINRNRFSLHIKQAPLTDLHDNADRNSRTDIDIRIIMTLKLHIC